MTTGPLAYSPNGCSIACASNAAIIIWDVQTGGAAEEIKCSPNNISLAWLSDGGTICTINSEDQTFIVHTYNVSSGIASSPGILQSGDNPHLWVDNESFWVMTIVRGGDDHGTINIFKVGSTLTKIQSIIFPLYNARVISFSLITHHISISNDLMLRIWNIQNTEYFSVNTGHFLSHCFSLDGSHFAASQKSSIHIWKYVSDCYIPWREFQYQGRSDSPLQFSPTLSSISSHSGNILQVLHLHEFPTALEYRYQPYVGLSHSGTHIATAYRGESTVEVRNLLAQTPSQLIETNLSIEGLALTGNILLVATSGSLMAWLLTKEGLVDGTFDDGQVSGSDIIWTISAQLQDHDLWMFWVKGQVGVVKLGGNATHVYHTETGEVLHPTQVPQPSTGDWHHLGMASYGRDYFCHHNLSQHNTPHKYSQQTLQPALQEGWVKDSTGKHWLWVLVEWRMDWDPADWRHDVTTQFSNIGGRRVLIKF
jgi:hypothetical protein